jgi:hypothetical protein
MDRRFDWLIDCKIDSAIYLDYPGSKLKPVIKMSVTYRVNPRFGDNYGKAVKYEELWFSQGKVIGCRRQHNLDIPETYQGAIRFFPTASAPFKASTISGAMAHLVLDTGLKNVVLNVVFLPIDVFYDVVNDMSSYNFHSGSSGAPAGPIRFQVCSNPLQLSDSLTLGN